MIVASVESPRDETGNVGAGHDIRLVSGDAVRRRRRARPVERGEGVVDDGRQTVGIDAAVEAPLDRDGRPPGTVPEAVHVLELDGGAGLHQANGGGVHRCRTTGLACLGPADLDDRTVRRRRTEVLVEADDPVDLGGREVEGRRDAPGWRQDR